MSGAVRRAPAGFRVAGGRLCGLTVLDGLLWYSDAALQQILAVDPATGARVRAIPCPGVRTGLTQVDGYLVQVAGPARALRVLDPRTGRVLAEHRTPRPRGELCGIEAAEGVLWLGYRDPAVLDLHALPGMELLDSIPVAEDVAGLTVAGPYVAYANFPRAQVVVLDPAARREVRRVGVEGSPTGLAWDGRRFWYCDYANLRLRPLEVPGVAAARA